MARSGTSNPMIRILVFGAPGVGKNCLESRFSTGHWPPSYDPSLTLCSRRFYTFQYGPSSTPSGRDHSHSTASHASSSNPQSPIDPQTPFSTASTQVPSHTGTAGISIHEEDRLGPCRACLERSQTHLIEIINYPRLGSQRHRQQILAQGAYDAVLLVYSVGDRESYNLIKQLHAEIPLRAQHKRRKAAPRKASGLLSIFTPASVNGKGPIGTGHEAVCEGIGSGRAVVAIVGNKCDLDGDVAPDKERLGKDQVEDIDYAVALFGLPLLRGHQGRSSSALSTPSNPRQPQPCPTPNFSNDSSEALEEWLQVKKDNHCPEVVSPDPEVNAAGRDLSGSRTTVNSGRQVSHVDGEGLALELATQVPFFETSAKTGENVDELFEAIARAVLKEMGRGEVNPEALAKQCRHGCLPAATGVRETAPMIGIVAPRLDVPLLVRASASVTDPQDKNGSSVQQADTKKPEPGQTIVCEKHAVGKDQRTDGQCQQIWRRPSIFGRMKILWNNESTLAKSVAV